MTPKAAFSEASQYILLTHTLTRDTKTLFTATCQLALNKSVEGLLEGLDEDFTDK